MEADGEKELSTDSSYKRDRHLTIILGDQAPFPVSIYDAQNLRTLLVPGNYRFTTGIGNAQVVDLFHHLKCLRALDLSQHRLKELPGEVRNLMHLKYLNLSGNYFMELPETVCDLCNLQILDLNCCSNLEKLPKGMENLINLRQLVIYATPRLKFLPKGIGRLSSLRTLTDFIVSDGDERKECKLRDLENLNNLPGCLLIRGLGNVVDPDETKKANLKSRKHLPRLNLEFSPNGLEVKMGRMDDVIEALEPHPNLESLTISNYRFLSFPNWMMLLPNLRSLELSCCVSLPPLWKLPNLESLEIENMDSLEKVGVEFVGLGLHNDDGRIEASGIIAFPKLKQLSFSYMEEWEVWDAWNEWDPTHAMRGMCGRKLL